MNTCERHLLKIRQMYQNVCIDTNEIDLNSSLYIYTSTTNVAPNYEHNSFTIWESFPDPMCQSFLSSHLQNTSYIRNVHEHMWYTGLIYPLSSQSWLPGNTSVLASFPCTSNFMVQLTLSDFVDYKFNYCVMKYWGNFINTCKDITWHKCHNSNQFYNKPFNFT